jgi:hypothetical protein
MLLPWCLRGSGCLLAVRVLFLGALVCVRLGRVCGPLCHRPHLPWRVAPCIHPDYDHIVIANGANASGIFFNDLYATTPRFMPLPASAKTRAQCVTSNPVQPYTYCLPRDVDYALAITGVVINGVEDSCSLPLLTLLPSAPSRLPTACRGMCALCCACAVFLCCACFAGVADPLQQLVPISLSVGRSDTIVHVLHPLAHVAPWW